MTRLPAPVTVNDEYLAAIHGLLGEIRDRLPVPQQQPMSGQTAVSEPGKPAAGKRAGTRKSQGGM